MFYYLSEFKDLFPFLNIFKYITFRAGMAAVTTFLLCVILGPIFIRKFKQIRIQEKAKREDAPALDTFQATKEGTPTMGGVFIIGSILISVLLWADLSNKFIQMTIFTCGWLALVGFLDDYVKLLHSSEPHLLDDKIKSNHILSRLQRRGLLNKFLAKKGQRGLPAREKFLWELALGLLVGFFIYLDPAISTKLDVPFFKNLVINLGLFYIPFVAIIVVGTSNAVNLTDGLDGLAIGSVLIVTLTLGILSYITGHLKMAEYLFVPHITGTGELTLFCAAIMGASLGFLWFNCYPASIFMGDVGSLALGGSLGIIAVFIKKELLLVLLGGVFVAEALSVILQVMSVKLRKKRILKMSPLHHHLQLSGWNESKIIIRFW